MSFFSYEYDPNVKFDMYTPMHLIMLGIFALIMVLFFLFKNRIFASQKERYIRYGLATFLLVNQILVAVIEISAGHLYLPLHLCSISFILTIVLLYTNNEKIFRFVFFTGIIGGIISFAIPDLYHAGYNRFRFYEFIIAHSSIIFVPIYYLTCYQYKVTKKITLIVIGITNILGFITLPINMWLDRTGIIPEANYMFTMGPPPDVEGVFGKFPWHMLRFEAVLLVTFFALYFIANRYQNKTA